MFSVLLLICCLGMMLRELYNIYIQNVSGCNIDFFIQPYIMKTCLFYVCQTFKGLEIHLFYFCENHNKNLDIIFSVHNVFLQ